MRKTICMVMTLVMIVAISFALAGCGDPEKKAAQDAFTQEAEQFQSLLDARTAEADKAKEMIADKKIALDDTIQPALEKAVDSVYNDETAVPDMPSDTEEINSATEQMKNGEEEIISQTDDIKNLEEQLDKSRKQYAQIVAPTEEFVVKRLKRVKDVEKVGAVTEDTDANNLIGKQGSYYARVCFTSPLVKDEYDVYSDDPVEAGNDGGGCVEVFKTVSEAETRNDYLAGYDGQGILNPGSHNVYGTIIIRTSSEMKASDQKKMEKRVLKALTKLEKDSSKESDSEN